MLVFVGFACVVLACGGSNLAFFVFLVVCRIERRKVAMKWGKASKVYDRLVWCMCG